MADACQAFVVVDAASANPHLDALPRVLAKHHTSCVLLLTGDSTGAQIGGLVAACQASGAAVLLLNDANNAKSVGADGVHLAFPGSGEAARFAYQNARAILGAGAIVGTETGALRHDAMVLAELGASYVAFKASPEETDGWLLEHVSWWAQVFEVPCVAFGARTPQEALDLSQAGADFVAAGPAGGLDAAIDVLTALNVS